MNDLCGTLYIVILLFHQKSLSTKMTLVRTMDAIYNNRPAIWSSLGLYMKHHHGRSLFDTDAWGKPSRDSMNISVRFASGSKSNTHYGTYYNNVFHTNNERFQWKIQFKLSVTHLYVLSLLCPYMTMMPQSQMNQISYIFVKCFDQFEMVL